MPRITNKQPTKKNVKRASLRRPEWRRWQRGRARLWLLIILLIVLAGIGLVAAQWQSIYDWYRLRGYQPPATVSQLASQDTMTPDAEHIFFVNHPAIDEKQTFGSSCPSGTREQTIVLGCYHGGQGGIFVLNVSDPRLNGVMQVTAAHEMLHAAYDRLSSGEKQKVNNMLQDFYDHRLSDNRIKQTILAYRKTEPNDLVNEMHSIFGTEVASLPAPLEEYYARYFTNRAQVVAYAAQYKEVFASRQAAVDQDDAQLAAWKTQIDNMQNDLESKQGQINSLHNTLIAERSRGDVSGYNNGVPTYNSLIDTYNSEVQTVQSLINQYNQLVAQRNAIALQEDQLVKELQSNVTTINQ